MASVSLFSRRPPSLVGRFSTVHSSFSESGGPQEKTERDPVHDWTRWSHWAPCPHSVLPSSPTGGLTRSQSEGLKLLSVILMSGRPDRMIFNVCGFFGGGEVDVLEVGVSIRVTGLVSQRG